MNQFCQPVIPQYMITLRRREENPSIVAHTPGARHDSPGKVIIKYFLTFFTMESRYNFHD